MIEIKNLKKTYPNGVKALKGVNLKVASGQTTALVGESGCGKSTLAKILLGLETPTEGEILINGKSISDYEKLERARLIQMVFQDPASSLNPRMTLEKILTEPLLIQGQDNSKTIQDKVKQILSDVGFDESVLGKYPHMFSGGQKQRIVIARALILKPEIIIFDEPVSALDVSVQAQVLNLISDLQKKLNLSYLFISHDLHVVRWISHHVYVMYFGEIVEQASKEKIFSKAEHPYTQLLLESSPKVAPLMATI